MARETMGKCPWCRLVFIWQGRPLLRDALCPVCYGGEGGIEQARGGRQRRITHLERTSSAMRKFGWRRVTPLEEGRVDG